MLRRVIERVSGRSDVRLDIGRTQLRLRFGKTLYQKELAFPLKPALPSQEVLDGLQAALGELMAAVPGEGRCVDATVSDALARCWMVERVQGLANKDEIAALAERQMQDIYGDDPDTAGHWRIRVEATPFVAAWPAQAIPEALLSVLETAIAERGWQLGHLGTRFVSRFNERPVNTLERPGNDLYVLELDDALTVGIRGKSRGWLALRTHPPLHLMASDLPSVLRRDCRSAGVDFGQCRIKRLGGKGRGCRDLALDFAPSGPDATLRLGLGSAMLALVLAGAWSLTSDTVAVSSLHRTPLPGEETVAAINGVVDELNFPWGRVLESIETSVDDGLRISTIEADAREGRLSLQGEARDARLVLALPGRLRNSPLVTEARVISQAPVAGGEAAALPVRFAVEARLQPATGGEQP